MLGLSSDGPRIPYQMVSVSSILPGYEITKCLGVVRGVAEGPFPILSLEHVSIEKGGGLDDLVEKARTEVSRAAGMLGADAIVDLRFEVIGRHTEKGVLAYGTAVKCRKLGA